MRLFKGSLCQDCPIGIELYPPHMRGYMKRARRHVKLVGIRKHFPYAWTYWALEARDGVFLGWKSRRLRYDA